MKSLFLTLNTPFENFPSKHYEINSIIENAKKKNFITKILSPYDMAGIDYSNLEIPSHVMNMVGNTIDTHHRYLKAMKCYGSNLLNDVDNARDADNKMIMYLKLTANGIPTPKTIDLNLKLPIDKLFKTIENVNSIIGFPCIVKIPNMAMGVGVCKINNSVDLFDMVNLLRSMIATPENSMLNLLVQEYVSETSGKAIRAIHLGDETIGCFLKTSDVWKISGTGGDRLPYVLDDELKRMSKSVCEILNINFAGIDFHITKDGYSVCEVNTSPQFEIFDKIYPEKNLPELIVNFIDTKYK